MPTPVRKFDTYSPPLLRALPPGQRGPVRHLRMVPQPRVPDYAAQVERHNYRARFWQAALVGLTLFWGSALWIALN